MVVDKVGLATVKYRQLVHLKKRVLKKPLFLLFQMV